MNAEDVDTFARTIWGEARGEPHAGKVAVANVIWNRVRIGGWWGNTVTAVCRHPMQFSCWNDDDPNRVKVEAVTLNDLDYQRCFCVALSVGLGLTGDTTMGSTHYHARGITPKWAVGHEPIAEVGGHLFYNSVR